MLEFFIESHLMIPSKKLHNAYIEVKPFLSSLKLISDIQCFSEMNMKRSFSPQALRDIKGQVNETLFFYDSAPIFRTYKNPQKNRFCVRVRNYTEENKTPSRWQKI
jgi:hypothetical protein